MLLIREELRAAVTPGEHAVTIGVFDGVHRGHQMLVDQLRAEAATRGLGTGLITFHPHPVSVLRPDAPISYLTSLETRVERLRATGLDFVAVVQFTSEVAQVSAEDFARVLYEEAGMRLLMVGQDFALGRNREGTVERLAEIGAEIGFAVAPIELLPLEDGPVSSTRVRNALREGNMREAAELLGRPYALRGPVLHGEERGRAIGFPTLNLGLSPDLALPAHGVYVSCTELDGVRFEGCTNVGVRPTFGGERLVVETHLLDFDRDVYGSVITVELLARLRPEQRFDGPDALVAQIGLDVAATRAHFA
ncbi:MAG: bifunctional riboflavin kinase/FAD synthetase [Chloroflexi bacterium]|nr:bifunctional riboflavin kinase/FAD synthetase [Chloroflexota bacterium]